MTFIDSAARSRRRADDDPSRRNTGPASTTVSTILAEDTVLSHSSVSQLANGPVALFANPFREGAEEFCLLDADGKLSYVHRTPEGDGWVQEGFEDYSRTAITSLATAVHTDGSVWLFVASLLPGGPDAFELRGDSTWQARPSDGILTGCATLSVHYLPDRPATPCIVGVDAGRQLLQVLVPRFATADNPRRWAPEVLLALPQLPERFRAGLESDGTLRIYCDDGQAITQRTYTGSWEDERVVPMSDGGARLVGLWNAPGGLGCVFLASDGTPRVYQPFAAGGGSTLRLATAVQFNRLAAWQDDSGLLHLFCRSPYVPGVLQVVHQTGWMQTSSRILQPVFASAPHDGADVVVALPLAIGVGEFHVDPVPDPYPSQLLLPSAPGDLIRVASQDVTTSWWSEEEVALPSTGAAVVRRRHICDVTVLDGFGAPLSSWPVQLSSESTVDVEVAGRALRLGPTETAHVATDSVGKVSLRAPASGLTVPTIQVTAKGMAQGVSVDPAAGVQAFLAGTSVMAAHPALLSADELLNATVGDDWLVPMWHGQAQDNPILPTAQQVVDSCASVFAQARGAAPGPGFVVQRTDAGQPAYRRLAAGESPRAALGGSVAGDVWPYLHDVWRGVRDGVLGVTGYSTDGMGTFTVQCLTSGGVPVLVDYELSTDADAALAVEVIFQQLEAGVDRLVEWLAWTIPFEQIWNTATALSSALDGFPDLLSAAVNHYQALVKPNWFTEHQQQAADALASVRDVVRGGRVDSLRGVSPLVSKLPAQLYQPETLISPASTWLQDLLAGEPAPGPANRPGATDPSWDELWRVMTESTPGESFQAAFTKAGQDLLALWDPDDSCAVPGTPMEALVDIVAGALPQALALADVAFPQALGVMTSVSTTMKSSLAEPVTEPGLNDFYAWFQRQAGIAAGSEVPLTRGGLGVLYTALPTTGAYLSVLGSAPFPTGTFPAYSLPWVSEQTVGNNWRELCLGIQVFAGLAQVLYTGIDIFLDVRESTQWVNYGIALFELVGFALAGLPLFYDTPADAVVADEIAWAQWGLWTWLYAMDFYLSFEAEDSTLVTLYSGRAGNSILFLVGVAQIVLAGAAYTVSDQTELDQDWLSGAVGASLSTLTAPLRLLQNLPPGTRGRDTGLAWKTLIDLFADMYSGVKYVALPVYQIQHPVAISTTSLPDAQVGQKYLVTVSAAGGCPPYTWALEGLLPDGIEFDESTGTFSGAPAPGTQNSFELFVGVTDYYPPPSTAGASFTLKVT